MPVSSPATKSSQALSQAKSSPAASKAKSIPAVSYAKSSPAVIQAKSKQIGGQAKSSQTKSSPTVSQAKSSPAFNQVKSSHQAKSQAKSSQTKSIETKAEGGRQGQAKVGQRPAKPTSVSAEEAARADRKLKKAAEKRKVKEEPREAEEEEEEKKPRLSQEARPASKKVLKSKGGERVSKDRFQVRWSPYPEIKRDRTSLQCCKLQARVLGINYSLPGWCDGGDVGSEKNAKNV